MAIQERNPELVDLLSADFQLRNEPNFAFKSCVSIMQAIPVLRGLWSMSSIKETAADQVADLSGLGNHLTANASVGSVTFGRDTINKLPPVANFSSANSQYLSRADGGAGGWADISGTESYVIAAQRGLTVGGWFYSDLVDSAAHPMVSKLAGAGSRSYELRIAATDDFNFIISDDGTNTDDVDSSIAPTDSGWFFVVGRFNPSTSVDIFVNGTWDTQATARASVFDSATIFAIAARSSLTVFFDGRMSLVFLSAAYVSDAIVDTVYQWTKSPYGR